MDVEDNTPEEEAEAQKQADAEKNSDDTFINDLLNPVSGNEEEETEEQKRQKNKNAEEARKRREAEAKAKADSESKAKAEAESKAKADKEAADAKAKSDKEAADKKAAEDAERKKEDDAQKEKVNVLGAQLVDFKAKYPDVDLAELDKDRSFKTFIDGKLLGKKDFTKLYEDYLDMKSEISGADKNESAKNYQKANSSSGSSKTNSIAPSDVYSEEELKSVSEKLPYMSAKDASKVSGKIEASIAYYDHQG